MSIAVRFDVLNTKNSPSIGADVFANRPTSAANGAIYISTDTNVMYRWNGSTWATIGAGISGSGTINKIPVWTSSGTLGDSDLIYTVPGAYPNKQFVSGASFESQFAAPTTNGQAAGWIIRRTSDSNIIGMLYGQDTTLSSTGSSNIFHHYIQDNYFLKVYSGTTNYYHSFFKNGRVVFNGYTDAGYQFDVQGTSRFNNTLRIDGTAGYTADLFTCYINGGTVAAFKIDMYGRTYITNAGVNAVAAVIGVNTTFGQRTSDPILYSGSNTNAAIGYWNGVKTAGLPTFDTSATSGWAFVVDNGNNGSYNELTIGGTMATGQQASKNLITIDQFTNNGTMVFGSTAGSQTYTLINCPISVSATSTGKILRFIRYNPTISGTTLASHYAATFSSGQIGVGTDTPNASAQVDLVSTTQGLGVMSMTTTQKNAIASPRAGLMVYDNVLLKMCFYDGTAWRTITSV